VGYSVSVANFAVYQGDGLLLDLVTKEGVIPAGKDKDGKPVDEPLYLFFIFLFAKYGNDPPHEFTGALQAARFTPALRFETMNPSVRSIRVHYRFHFQLDSYLENAPAVAKLIKDVKEDLWGIENYASIIRDADDFPSSVLPAIRLFKDIIGAGAELKFFESQLEACNFEWTCRFETAVLGLELSQNNSNTLKISFRDPRRSIKDALKVFEKTVISLTDAKVSALSVIRRHEFSPAAIEELTAKIFAAIEGNTLPGISDDCLKRNIKYLLLQVVVGNYRLRKGEDLLKQLLTVARAAKTDLADILKYLKPGEFEQVLADIEAFVRALLQEPFLPVIGPIITLVQFKKLIERIQKLAGRMISIVAFDAAEKPVLYEIAGLFVQQGEVTNTWDNLHWWGTEQLPSAPGAFHAVHSHYRWTRLNAYPTAEETSALEMAIPGKLHLGAPQLRSLVKKFRDRGLSGPLIDPQIPKQTISFAIALNDGELDKKLKESNESFEDVKFDGELNKIATVEESENSGKDIVYWLSCLAERTQDVDFKGTLFVNGFYFTHDEERPFSLFRTSNMFGLTQGVDLQKPQHEKPYRLFRRPFG